MSKLSVKLVVIMIITFLLAAAIIGPLYVWYQAKAYTDMEIGRVSQFSQHLKTMETFDKDAITDYYNEASVDYRVYIFDDQFEVLYSSYELGFRKNLVERLFSDKLTRFSEDAKPYFSTVDNESAVRLYALRYIDGQRYYIQIKDSFSGVQRVFDFTNRVLLEFAVLYILLCVVVLILAVRPSIRSIKETTSVASKISEGDFSVRYKGKQSRDETGQLAKSVNRMADEIQDHITELNNYNFVLREDNVRLQEYEGMRQKVIRNITHDLKTPLAIISSQVEMMNSCNSQEKKDYYYHSAMEEIAKMSSMISEVLGITAEERKQFSQTISRINISERIQALCDGCADYAKAKDISVHTDIEKGIVLSTFDNHIDYVFYNFLSNAIRLTKAGDSVRFSLHAEDHAARFSVWNEGEAIGDKDRENIWNEGFTTKKDEKNAGLGLYIVKEISLIEQTECGFCNRDGGVEFWFIFADLA